MGLFGNGLIGHWGEGFLLEKHISAVKNSGLR